MNLKESLVDGNYLDNYVGRAELCENCDNFYNSCELKDTHTRNAWHLFSASLVLQSRMWFTNHW